MAQSSVVTKKKKPTIGPFECDHCHKTWYGTASRDEMIPNEKILCGLCKMRLSEYLNRNFKDICDSFYRNNEDAKYLSPIHTEVSKWIADPQQKPLRPKDIYRGGGVPKWMQSAIEKGLVKTNSEEVYTVTVNDLGEAISVEVNQQEKRWVIETNV